MSATTNTDRGGMRGKRVLVIGATRGIGRACAAAVVREGGQVIAVGRERPGLDRLSSELGAERVRTHVCDVTDLSGLRDLFAGINHFDGLVNAAGTNIPQPFDAVTPETFDTLHAVNVRSAYFALQLAAQRLIELDRPGSLVTISSQMGHVGAPLRSVYCSTKHAVEGMSKALAVELADRRIRINTVAPTFIATDLTAPMLADPAFRADVIERIPAGRIGVPDEVAEAVLFLLTPASALVTGTSIRTDGGWTAQ